MDKAKRPYEGMEAYEAGRKDAIKDLYNDLEKMGECIIRSPEDTMNNITQKIHRNKG